MKNIVVLLLFLLSLASVPAQTLTGEWLKPLTDMYSGEPGDTGRRWLDVGDCNKIQTLSIGGPRTQVTCAMTSWCQVQTECGYFYQKLEGRAPSGVSWAPMTVWGAAERCTGTEVLQGATIKASAGIISTELVAFVGSSNHFADEAKVIVELGCEGGAGIVVVNSRGQVDQIEGIVKESKLCTGTSGNPGAIWAGATIPKIVESQ